ncbi:MAG: pseudouridine synthase [Terracidiphilus sp.]|jgi:23S rRNA pseudouridine2605 synthase
MTDENRPEANEEELISAVESEDPIGDETDGEAQSAVEAEMEADDEADAAEEAEDEAYSVAKADSETGDEGGTETENEVQAEAAEDTGEDEPEFKPKARPPVKLERLQKILAQSGVASRRKAEEMIEQGRVQVNGKVVTELGTKADAGRDHIRVDGKLLQGAERLRYFVLNKPRGFVTTVKDPEGRPTVMQFFDKMRERLYPVGRLDYMSEGLLLVTNDGELANKLTKASAGVEKTYLVKVAGIPSEAELDILRAGVAIEKGKPGSGKVRTSPARIRQVRQGDNPWYEVVLIEGRNRELRKMFEEIGHFVEKIRRVGYGPLILDQEPGNLRELDTQELELLRKAADGKLRTPKAKEIRRRNIVDSLPPEKPAFKPRGERPAAGPKDYKPKRSFGTDRPVRSGTGPAKFGPAKFGPGRFGPAKPAAPRPVDEAAERPAWKKDDRAARPAGRTFAAKPGGSKPGGRPFGDRPATGRSFPAKPAWKKPERQEWPQYHRPPEEKPRATRRPGPDTARPRPEPMEDLGPRKPTRLHIEPVPDFGHSERARPERARPDRTGSTRPPFGRAVGARPGAGRSDSRGSSSARPFRSEGGMARPFTTSSGKPRAGGARPSSKPGKDGGRSYSAGAGRSGAGRGGAGAGARPDFAGKRPFESKGSAGAAAKRPYTPRGESAEGFRPSGEGSRPERRAGTGWKPKPSFDRKSAGGGRSGPRSGPKAGGFSKSGSKGKPSGSGAKRTGARPGSKKPGGRRP